METGQRGSWEPIVTDEMFDLTRARLNDPRRTTNRQGTDRKYLGSGLYLCDQCGTRLVSFSGGRYHCRANGCLARSGAQINALVVAVIAERLRKPDAADLLAQDEQEFAPVLAEVNRLRQRLESIGNDYDQGLIDGARYATATEKVKAELRNLERQLSTYTTAPTLATDDPAAAFLAAPLMTQRAPIDALVSVRLKKAPRGSRPINPESVQITWKASA